MRLTRYERANFLFNSYLSSKAAGFGQPAPAKLDSAVVSAGPYRPNSIMPEHSLILSNLSGRPSKTILQAHGKRRRKTILISAEPRGRGAWLFFDKILHELIPLTQDFVTPKARKARASRELSIRVRQKLGMVEDFDDLIENSMYGTHKGVYLPLSIHLKAAALLSSPAALEAYFRMLGFPINFFVRRSRPAFDDKVVFAEFSLASQPARPGKKR